MFRPQLSITSSPLFDQHLNEIVESGKPYTVTIEIEDVDDKRYQADFDVVSGGMQSEAFSSGIVACFTLCESMPRRVILKEVQYINTMQNN